MRPGDMRERVVLQHPPDAESPRDGHGAPSGWWTDGDAFRARVTIGPTQQVFEGSRLKTIGTATVECRIREDVDPSKRLRWDKRCVTRYLYVVGVTYPEGLDSGWMLISCHLAEYSP